MTGHILIGTSEEDERPIDEFVTRTETELAGLAAQTIGRFIKLRRAPM